MTDNEFNDRIEYLRQLKDGWFDGEGQQLESLDWLQNKFNNEYNTQKPYLFPTPHGEILAEWDFDGQPSLEINLKTKQAEWLTNAEEKDLDLNNPNDWQWFVERITQITTAYFNKMKDAS